MMIRIRNYHERGHRIVNEMHVVQVQHYVGPPSGSALQMSDGTVVFASDSVEEVWQMMQRVRHDEPFSKRREGKRRRAERRLKNVCYDF